MSKKSDLGITIKKEDNFSDWFTELMLKAELADYTEVSGCIVFRPRSYLIWEKIVAECDLRFKKAGIQNAYFPLLIPEKLLIREQDHIDDFNPLVAWVTKGGGSDLNEKLAIRPTSEAIMYDSYSKWIRSYRDLPLRLNQWNNVVRWEFKHPVPFFRTREFLWNEGHTVFATEKEAMAERDQILAIYDEVCSEYLALPGIIGKKTESEKFAGAVFSEKIHYFLPNGRVIEGPAFHFDGQNFAKAYDIKFTDENSNEAYVWQNTFAITTRMLGAMFSIHSDNNGLIIPPRLCDSKVVIVPLFIGDNKEKVLKSAHKIFENLNEFNPILDDRDEIKPGRKYFEWELKGLPVRIEIGPNDIERDEVVIVKRTSKEKIVVKTKDVTKKLPLILDEIQNELFNNAKKLFDDNTVIPKNYTEFKKIAQKKKVMIAPLCKKPDCEEKIKSENNGVKSLFIDNSKSVDANTKCIVCGDAADYTLYFGKTY